MEFYLDFIPMTLISHKVNVIKENKIINETIHYIYSDGRQAAEDYKATPLEFTRIVSTDVVTDNVSYGAWTSEQLFKSVNSPKIDGYTPDKSQIEKQVVEHDSKDLDFTVIYTKIPTTPTTPTTPITPITPITPTTPTTPTAPTSNDSTLPMTGEASSGFAIVIGVAILSIIGFIFAKLRSSKNSK